MRTCLILATLAALCGSANARETTGQRAMLDVGPLIGGQDLVIDLRTSVPHTPMAFLVGFDGTPTVSASPFGPVYGLNLLTAQIIVSVTDGTGRLRLEVPTTGGDYGPAGSGLPAFSQALVIDAFGKRIVSNREAVEVEPASPPSLGYLSEVPIGSLPVGADQVGGDWVVAGDLDRDGDEDLVISGDGELILWRNNGACGFTEATSTFLTPPSQAVGPVNVVDLTGNNALDIVVMGGYDDLIQTDNRVFVNDGFGNFTEFPLPTEPGLVSNVDFADLDRDGLVDMLVAVGAAQHLPTPGGLDRIYYNGGFDPVFGFTFTEDMGFAAAAFNTPTERTTAIRPGDVDNDGDSDLLLVRITTGVGAQNRLLINTGTFFTDQTATRLNPGLLLQDNSSDAAFADLDGDGWLDIVVANSHGTVSPGSSGDVLMNRGALGPGVFDDVSTQDLDDSTPLDFVRLGLSVGDLDGDGDTDVLMTTHEIIGDGDQLLYLNDGGAQGGVQGELVRQTWFDPGSWIVYGSDIFDCDGDGDNDMIFLPNGVVGAAPDTGEFQPRLFINGKL